MKQTQFSSHTLPDPFQWHLGRLLGLFIVGFGVLFSQGFSSTSPQISPEVLRELIEQRPHTTRSIEAHQLALLVTEVATDLELDPLLLLAIIEQESGYRTAARSLVGAVGLMQVRPSTGKAIASKLGMVPAEGLRLSDPAVNMYLGGAYLKEMLSMFNDEHLALTAYNEGPTRVRIRLRKGKRAPMRYAARVLSRYRLFQKHYLLLYERHSPI